MDVQVFDFWLNVIFSLLALVFLPGVYLAGYDAGRKDEKERRLHKRELRIRVRAHKNRLRY